MLAYCWLKPSPNYTENVLVSCNSLKPKKSILFRKVSVYNWLVEKKKKKQQLNIVCVCVCVWVCVCVFSQLSKTPSSVYWKCAKLKMCQTTLSIQNPVQELKMCGITMSWSFTANHLYRFKVGHLWFQSTTNPPVELNDQLLGLLSHILVTIVQQLWQELQQWFDLDHFCPKVSATHSHTCKFLRPTRHNCSWQPQNKCSKLVWKLYKKKIYQYQTFNMQAPPPPPKSVSHRM